mmetsp:Transcript_115417/g.337513  ORF Transcript_115417/g.337513 Transcript_115417/m.337513 type:complete len:230 (+) Transcript_115417:444-1133(+)
MAQTDEVFRRAAIPVDRQQGQAAVAGLPAMDWKAGLPRRLEAGVLLEQRGRQAAEEGVGGHSLAFEDLRVLDERAALLHDTAGHDHRTAQAGGAALKAHQLHPHDHVLYSVGCDIAVRADADLVFDVEQVVLKAMAKEADALANSGSHEAHEGHRQPSPGNGLQHVVQGRKRNHECSPPEMEPGVIRPIACLPTAYQHPLQHAEDRQHAHGDYDVEWRNQEHGNHLAQV